MVAAGMATLGFIGSGNIGGTVARLAVAAGYDVVLANRRGPDTLSDLVASLGSGARAATPTEAAAAAGIVVATIPLHSYRDLPTDALRDTVVIDTMNYYPGRDGTFPELEDESTTTSELVQAFLTESRVVKAFNNIFFRHLADLPRPSGAPDRSALPIAGDDASAKAEVTALLDVLGYDVVDAGPLAQGWRFQRDTAAYGLPYAAHADDWSAGAHPADAASIEAALAAARRYRDM
jgi:predicted dinucleotide-binding enzyme